MRKTLFNIFLCVLGAVITLTALVPVYTAYQYNSELEQNFDKKRWQNQQLFLSEKYEVAFDDEGNLISSYDKGFMPHEVGYLQILLEANLSDALPLTVPKPTENNTELPCELSYFRHPDDEQPAVVLPAGAMYDASKVVGISFPTYSADWRYIDFALDASHEEAYYITTENWIEYCSGLTGTEAAIDSFQPQIDFSVVDEDKATRRTNYDNVKPYLGDYHLYLSGAYISPNLYHHAEWTDIALLVSGVVLLLGGGIGLVMNYRSRRQRETADSAE